VRVAVRDRGYAAPEVVYAWRVTRSRNRGISDRGLITEAPDSSSRVQKKTVL
jgi:hypothetical protein